jgi:hypothetical protein
VAVDREQDEGPVVFPKLFRRYATWKVNARARMVDGSFGAFLRIGRMVAAGHSMRFACATPALPGRCAPWPRHEYYHPRHLADVDEDGRLDVIGFANEGTFVAGVF